VGPARPVGECVPGADRFLTPTNTTQRASKFAEQTAEYFIPGTQAERWSANLATRLPSAVPGLVPRMVVESGINAGVTVCTGATPPKPP